MNCIRVPFAPSHTEIGNFSTAEGRGNEARQMITAGEVRQRSFAGSASFHMRLPAIEGDLLAEALGLEVQQ